MPGLRAFEQTLQRRSRELLLRNERNRAVTADLVLARRIGVARRKHYARAPGERGQLAGESHPVPVREHYVQQNRVRPELAGGRARCLDALGLPDNAEAAGVQDAASQFPELGIVVDYQDARHGVIMAPGLTAVGRANPILQGWRVLRLAGRTRSRTRALRQAAVPAASGRGCREWGPG